ncbi:MAG: lysophospholipid acyltransferase family protein [Bdellovibrionia bacterium]
MIRKYFLSSLVFIIYKLLYWTWKIKIVEPPEMTAALKNHTPFIISHWHGDELALIHLAKYLRIATIVSTSKDGELMSTVLTWLGAKQTRGSSTRGGASALKGLIRLVKEGNNAGFAVDGPKGPIYKVKPGVFELSRLLQAPIYAAGVACDSAWHFPKAWNKTFLPKPFARIIIYWVGPIPAATKDVDPRDPQLAESLEMKLWDAQVLAQKTIAGNL